MKITNDEQFKVVASLAAELREAKAGLLVIAAEIQCCQKLREAVKRMEETVKRMEEIEPALRKYVARVDEALRIYKEHFSDTTDPSGTPSGGET